MVWKNIRFLPPLVETTIATEKDRTDAENNEKQTIWPPRSKAVADLPTMYMCVRVSDNEASWYHV